MYLIIFYMNFGLVFGHSDRGALGALCICVNRSTPGSPCVCINRGALGSLCVCINRGALGSLCVCVNRGTLGIPGSPYIRVNYMRSRFSMYLC